MLRTYFGGFGASKMTVEEREQHWAQAMRAERDGNAVEYERMLKEVARRVSVTHNE